MLDFCSLALPDPLHTGAYRSEIVSAVLRVVLSLESLELHAPEFHETIGPSSL